MAQKNEARAGNPLAAKYADRRGFREREHPGGTACDTTPLCVTRGVRTGRAGFERQGMKIISAVIGEREGHVSWGAIRGR